MYKLSIPRYFLTNSLLKNVFFRKSLVNTVVVSLYFVGILNFFFCNFYYKFNSKFIQQQDTIKDYDPIFYIESIVCKIDKITLPHHKKKCSLL